MSPRAASATDPDNDGYTPIVAATSATVRPRWIANVSGKIELRRVGRDHDRTDDDASHLAGVQLDEPGIGALHLRPGVGAKRKRHGSCREFAGGNRGVAETHRGDLGMREYIGRDGLQPQRAHGLAEGVPHRDPALHRRDRGKEQHAGTVARRVDRRDRGSRDPVDRDVAPLVEINADVLQAETGGIRHRPDAHERVRPRRGPPILQFDEDAIVDPLNRARAGVVQQGATSRGEHLLQNLSRVWIFTGQHPVATGHQRHRHPEFGVAARELRPGDAGSDNHQPLRQGGEVIDVAPGQNPLTIGSRRGQYPRRGPGAEQHDVSFEDLSRSSSEPDHLEPMSTARLV